MEQDALRRPNGVAFTLTAFFTVVLVVGAIVGAGGFWRWITDATDGTASPLDGVPLPLRVGFGVGLIAAVLTYMSWRTCLDYWRKADEARESYVADENVLIAKMLESEWARDGERKTTAGKMIFSLRSQFSAKIKDEQLGVWVATQLGTTTQVGDMHAKQFARLCVSSGVLLEEEKTRFNLATNARMGTYFEYTRGPRFATVLAILHQRHAMQANAG